MAYLEVADLKLYYEEHGRPDGQPLVLLHGGGGTADDPVGGWALMLPAFTDSFRVILVEHRGHGRTTNPAGFQSFARWGMTSRGFSRPWTSRRVTSPGSAMAASWHLTWRCSTRRPCAA